MSKLCRDETNKHSETVSAHRNNIEIQNNEHTTVCIGASNVKRWSELKTAYQYTCDVKFTSFLLNLAQKHRKKRNNENKKKYSSREPSKDEPTRRSSRQRQTEYSHKHKKSQDSKSHRKKLAHKEETTSKSCDKKDDKSKRKSNDLELNTEIPEEKIIISRETEILQETLPLIEKNEENLPKIVKLNREVDEQVKLNEVGEEINIVEEEVISNEEVHKIEETYVILTETTQNNTETIEKKSKHKKKHKTHSKIEEPPEINQNILEIETKSKPKSDKNKRKVKHHDIRKAPQLDLNQIKSETTTENISIPSIPPQSELVEEIKTERVAIKIKLCVTCNTRHLQESCPLLNPAAIIQDFVDFESWKETSRNENDKNNDSSSDEQYPTFAETSLPPVLYFEQSDSSHGLSVFAKCDIKEFTRFGPLVGNVLKEVDISEDSSMQHVWEIYSENNNIYINTEDTNTSNWIRYMRPAPTRELKNMLALSYSQQIYIITTRDIIGGEELLYWQDDASGSTKKKLEKTNCGGCNLTFTHPLYYRIHCSVFHDVRYSLTIRKYHCKVCGAAVLGKDNIMKHAVELHNGQGAYQCQFCKKFFLRLNYLEMHRTYGCAANPHRSRPLCDFCGRKFCQPQKLKVHIKRMHSDMAEVLREFQCKNCLKLLGSRAALQRHVKEVHQKQMDGSCTCVRCGKLFQNKSNLKIHMLTHSGIKPFKCKESNCNAAFTTKQCLQFHYKKVHGFAEDIMPKIERSVEYTFAAYAGVKDGENNGNGRGKRKRQRPSIEESNLMSMDDSTDIDDISLDDKNLDEPPALDSPLPMDNDLDEDSSRCSNQTPPMLEDYSTTLKCTKMQSKGSKKWLGENIILPQPLKDVYQFEKEIEKPTEPSSNILLDVDESQPFDRTKINVNLNVYNRHESSNASLLVEAALDSVSDIQMSNSEHNVDVVNSSCNDLNNLYLSHQDNLPDVTYNHSEDLNESRDINLISPSVNDHISVTDHDLNDDPNRGISLDYSTLHHNDFSPSNSPNHNRSGQLLHDYNIHVPSPAHTPRSRLDYTLGHDSEIVSPGTSPPRYDFHHTPVENLSSDESNGIVAQNLSLNNSKDKLRLDLTYKSHYGDIDSAELRKYDLRHLESERNKLYDLEVNDRNKNYIDSDVRTKFLSSTELDSDLRKSYDNLDHSDLKLKQFEIETEFRNKYHDDQMDSKYESNKLEMDVDLRSKTYDGLDSERNKTYETSLETEIRNKSYDVIDELRPKTYDLDAEFRSDRNFEPLVLNSTELQGLDMSARSYHNFHPTGQGLNRYHHLYSELDRPSVDLRLGYSPPPPTYSDVLRVVSLDLTPPGRHSVDLSLRSHALHSHQLPNRLLSDHPLQTNRLISTDHNLTTNRILSEHNRLALDQTRLEHNLNNRLLSSETRLLPETGNRLLSGDLNTRLLGSETRLIPETSSRLLSDHTTNRLLSNDQLSSNRLLPSEPGRLLSTDQGRLLGDETTRLLTDQSRLLDQTRLIGDTRILQPTPTTSHEIVARTSLSPVGYSGYPVSPSPYHASSLAARPHGNSPGHTASYHHYSAYY